MEYGITGFDQCQGDWTIKDMVIVLHYRRLKQVQSELTEDVLNLKRLDLGEASCKQDESNKSKLGQSPTPKLEQDEKYEDDINSIEDRFVEISKEYASNKRLITEQDNQ
ncbi:hypothetical protein RO3G_00268 [Rhizopus delemar RA 99-880]|uniref:Uncharacterized protein n=1 Tax=Rhizopus delemar (strain RA 99-880 / ATCC MYA-4621 / FGSC 9543 / NRRL 43880) TaxID=246409 RepID=I1BH84_RHIO9|nr:hypothetical protein RO3G_00268 [Rhizopus delemar RA 99-880]|eukprot:EIE75564.1 hypothetical protein RO3G_00268 [Rhizopus delemar RA 99-880]